VLSERNESFGRDRLELLHLAMKGVIPWSEIVAQTTQ
jgi:hypothetical protein